MTITVSGHDSVQKVALVEVTPKATVSINRQLHSLTALRFFAAAAIVILHVGGSLFRADLGGRVCLSHGVSFFFVLSGFILTYVHPQIQGWAQTVKFWRARVARIYPAHIVALLMVALITPLPQLKETWPEFIANLFLVQSWIPSYHYFFSFNLPAWSVSTELFFYLAFPFLIVGITKNWPIKLVASFALAMCTIMIPHWAHMSTAGLEGLSCYGMHYIFPTSRLFEFVLGMSCAVIWQRLPKQRFGFGMHTVMELGSIALVVCFALAASDLVKAFTLNPAPFAQSFGTWATYCSNCIFFGVLIVTFAFERGAVSKLIRTGPFVWLGEISYSLYIVHYQILCLIMQAADKHHWKPWFSTALFLAILFPVCHLVYHFVEKPMRAWINGKRQQQRVSIVR